MCLRGLDRRELGERERALARAAARTRDVSRTRVTAGCCALSLLSTSLSPPPALLPSYSAERAKSAVCRYEPLWVWGVERVRETGGVRVCVVRIEREWGGRDGNVWKDTAPNKMNDG